MVLAVLLAERSQTRWHRLLCQDAGLVGERGCGAGPLAPDLDPGLNERPVCPAGEDVLGPYLEDRKTGSVDFDSLVADEIKVRVYGDTAIVTYRSTAKGKDQDGAIDEQRRWTRVFVRKDGRWQLVHSQGTTIKKP